MLIFEHSDYRNYLRAWLRALPKNGRGEINRMAEHLGVNATVISQTLSGARDFTPEQTFEVAQFIGLGELESEFFSLLVQIERAANHKYKTHLKAKLETMRAESLSLNTRIQADKALTDQQRAVFYSSYLYSAIRLFASIGGGKTLEAIVTRFEIPRARAQEIVSFLIEAGLCEQSGDLIKLGAQVTYLDANSPFIQRHRTNWHLRALHRSESLSAEELMFSAPFSIAKKDFAKVRQRLAGFMKDLFEDVKNSDAEDVAAINIDLFWIEK